MRGNGVLGRRLGAGLLVLVVGVTAGWLAFFYGLDPALSLGREQPIPFSHRLHNTDKQIDCLYCHPTAERSLNAGLPPLSTCLGCHEYIIPRHPQILKLKGYRDQRQNPPWVRVFYAPQHVFFPHYRHLGKGVQCTECHGPVPALDRLPTETFYMGFCINCHQARGASRECVGCHQ